MPLRRCEDWPAQLDAAIVEARERAFKWGEHDCALWAAAVVERMTGRDFAAELRGTYHTALGANRIIARRGGLAEIVDDALGRDARVMVTRAQRGDVVIATPSVGRAIGICVGKLCAFPGVNGLIFLNRKEAHIAWHV